MRVHATYPFTDVNAMTVMDRSARAAAQKEVCYSGCGFGERDLGWTHLSEIEAERIARAVRKIGLTAEIKPD